MNFNEFLGTKDSKYKNLKLYEKKKTDDLETTLRFNYKSGVFSDEDRKKISHLAVEYFNVDNEKYIIKLKRYYMDEEVLCDLVFNYINDNYANLTNFVEKRQISIHKVDENFEVVIPFPSAQLDYLIRKKFDRECENYLSQILFDNAIVKLTLNDNSTEDEGYEELEQLQEQKIRSIYENEEPKERAKLNMVFEQDSLVGIINDEIAIQIGSLSAPAESITIAGKILYINNLKFTPKNQKVQEGEVLQQKDYFTFQLGDGSGTLRCVYFPRKDDVEKGKFLKDGDKIVVNGELELNNNNFNLKVKSIALCNFEAEKMEKNSNEIQDKPVNEEYILISPTPYQDYSQANLFDCFEQPMTEYFKSTDFVVFDLETTGIDFMTNDITEIGAVKIHDGKITECFTTLIKPDKTIEEDTIRLNGITNELVADSPKISQVIPDFYKFCNNSVIVAYNIGFDYKFLDKASMKIGYKFNQKQLDALYLARLYVPGLKNFKLKSVVDKLNITLDNAHRALFDTLATAKLLLKLADKINE